MSFKEILESDVHDVFMNVDEFSDMHMVNGKEMAVQIDSNEQIEREKRMSQHMDGIYANQKLVYVAASDFGNLPCAGFRIETGWQELQSGGCCFRRRYLFHND